MKGDVDLLVTTAILVFTVLMASLMLWTTFSTGGLRSGTLVSASGSRNQAYAGVQSLMSVRDATTGRTIGELLGDAAAYGSNVLDYGTGKAVNVRDVVKSVLDEMYGGRYLFELDPLTGQVDVIFVLDTSGSLEDERDALERSLPGIIQSFGAKGYNIYSKIYVLSGESQGFNESKWCSGFENNRIQNISCEAVTPQSFQSSNIMYDKLLADNIRLVGYYYVIQNKPYDLKSEDWGDGVAYASIMGFASPNEQINYTENWPWKSEIRVVIPISDEMSGGSESMYCEGIDTESGSEAQRRERKINKTACGFCNTSCPGERSLEAVTRAISVANYNGVIVCPIKTNIWSNYSNFLDSACCLYFNRTENLGIKCGAREATRSIYSVCGFYGGCDGTAEDTENPDYYGFKPMCERMLEAHMNALAEETGCESYMEISDAGGMAEKLERMIEDVLDRLKLRVGEAPPKEAKSVAAYNFVLPVPTSGEIYKFTTARLYKW